MFTKGTAWVTLAIGLCLLFVAETARAEKYNREAQNYTVMLEGPNQMRFKIPTYEKVNYDCHCEHVNITIQIDGQPAETLLYLRSEEDISDGNYTPYVKGYKGVDGTMVHYRDRGWSAYTITNSETQWNVPCVENQTYTCMNVLWTIPAKYRGKMVTIKWDVKTDGYWLDVVYPSISDSRFSIPAAPAQQEPKLMTPVISYSKSNPNQIMVPYMIAATEDLSVTAIYDEVNGASTIHRTLDLGDQPSEFIRLHAEHPIRNLYLQTSYTDSEKTRVTTRSAKIDVPILHQPKALSAEVMPDGKVVLKWDIKYSRWQDVMPNDTWEVQRNTSGNSSVDDVNWQSIGQVNFDENEATYSYTDESLLHAYAGKTVYYRVRRAITSLWGWSEQSGYAMTSLPATLRLPGIGEATAQRNGEWTENDHSVNLRFRLGDSSPTDSQGRFILRTAEDWNAFAKKVNDGQTNLNAIMAADIDLGTGALTMVGNTVSSVYTGTFDGNGHTLTFAPKDTLNEQYFAPFRFVGNATIRNLHTRGHLINKQKFTAGLIARLTTGAEVLVENCRSMVDVDCTVEGDATNGGLVANAEESQRLTLRNCLFDGRMLGENSNNSGGLVGWSRGMVVIENCLFAPSEILTSFAGCDNYARMSDAYNLTIRNSYHTVNYGTISSGWRGTSAFDMTADDLLKGLGETWTLDGSQIVPKMTISDALEHSTHVWDERAKLVLNTEKLAIDGTVRYTERHELTKEEREKGKLQMDLTTSCVDHRFRFIVEKGNSTIASLDSIGTEAKKAEFGALAIYRFDKLAKSLSAKADTLQSAVSLSWKAEGGDVDYYRIMRYDQQNPDKVTMLEEDYTQTAYVDRTVQPQHIYVYIIQGVTQCEGEHTVSTILKGCGCRATGMVRGYVRLANGIGLPNVTVTASPQKPAEGNEGTCVTDSTGFYEIGGLSYQNVGEYTLSASGFDQTLSVTFDDISNLITNINFYEQTYYNFSGYVLYDGSSIPVSGVSFLRDGQPVVDASGQKVTTDNQGAFVVNIPAGPHTIQVVKDGHVFENDGFYVDLDKLDGDKRKPNWQKDRSEVYLWDKTKVNLQGRVVGGNVEGMKPLGESLSKNNLGDSLTIVMQLEGDNTSWIVRDQLDSKITSRFETFAHGKADSDTTFMESYRHRIVIHPDSVTGEYRVPLYPVKYKVTEVYAHNYPTLFQSGTFSETLDLTNFGDGDTATYSRIYHVQPTLDIWQFQGTQERYYGLKQYISRDNAGERDTITLWKDGEYAMGYPVFMAGAPVPMLLTAQEEYYYNNEKTGSKDIVKLDGGHVKIANGLVDVATTDTLSLDSEGQGTYVFTPQNTTFVLEDDMALRTMKFTLEYDSTFYDINPIQAFVMAAVPKPQGRHIIAGKNVHLIDVLRDPPGSGSSAYIEKGSKISYAYTADYSVQVGATFSLGLGAGADFYTGIWAGVGSGTEAGSITSSDNLMTLSYTLGTKYYQNWSYEYEFETTEKISTSDHEKEVGMNSDVYIGMTDNVLVDDAIAVRMVNRKALERLRPGMGGEIEVNGHTFDVSGTAKILARGYDAAKDDSVYLVRDEVMSLSSKISSTFAYSQCYLRTELLPTLIRTRNALLMDSTTTAAYAQALANEQKRPVYVSKVGTDSEIFALGDSTYTRYTPSGVTDQWNDTIQALNTQIKTWIGLIAANEKEKLEAYDLVKIYDFDGRSNVEYSETFTTTDGLHRYWQLPAAPTLTGEDGFTKELKGNNSHTKSEQENGITTVGFEAGGKKLELKITPLVGFDFNYENGTSTEYKKETGFTLACSRKSSLTVAVYKTRELSADSLAKLAEQGGMNIFYKNVEDNLKLIYNGRPGSSNTTSYINNLGNVPRYRNFVFRTLAGATASPWEEERCTEFYNPGAILDQATQQINKLRIWAKEPSVSNVPYGEPARFTIYITTESEMPERISNEMKFYLEDKMNPKGAKIFVDGMPLTGTGIDLWMDPGVIYEKQVEVYAGAEYDYENLGITLYDEHDVDHTWTVNLSAHFVPAAGPVNISKPGDKWVVNTESTFDGKKKLYYLPVHIDGFDVNFRNFDHIELQYKLSTQGDKDWVNVCSYYPNTEEGKRLMEQASGEKELMKNDGSIDANFYGEIDPVEQYYDIRAVCYCRHGSGYLTRASNIVSGIKDTRRPQAFGTPQPTNGILGIGDDIKIAFSEKIAGNYLSPVNNFEVLGLSNQSSLSLATALQFDGSSSLLSLSSRNLAAKDFTLDLMMKPRRKGKDMNVMSHVTINDNSYMNLGVSEDWRLKADVNGIEIKSDSVVDFTDMKHVAYVFDVDEEKNMTNVTFYKDDVVIGQNSFEGMYSATSNLIFGNNFEGEMLEVRLWNKAMTKAELGKYAGKRLTGTELGLLDNYPMDEGRGDYAYDKAVGSNDLRLIGATWKVPDGISLALDTADVVRLNPQPFNRSDYEDYSLMLWFRTNDANGTLMSNGKAKTEVGSENHFNIGFEDGDLFFRSGGRQVTANGVYNDGAWHHVAVTVNRARNVGNFYVDQKLEQSFPVDSLGGIAGNALSLGGIKGNVDEVAMFEMALPENVLRLMANQTPSGEEMGLLAYLPFSQTEKQKDNTQRLMPLGLSIKRYKDNHGEVVEAHRDTIIARDIVERLADRRSYAPMTNSGKLESIKYSYVAKDNELLVNLDVPDYQIEKTNVYVTVKEVADLQGNLMASPVTMDLYVYRNPLRWSVKRKAVNVKYGEGATVDLTIKNLSGKTKDYTLEGLPKWITASTTGGKIAALDEIPVTLTISPYINIGDFEEILYIVGENGITEPLPLNIHVRGEAPAWAVDDQLKEGNVTMHMVARVMVGNEILHDTDDVLAAVGSGYRTLGTAHVETDPTTGSEQGLAYLTIYNKAGSDGTPIGFVFYDANTGRIYSLTPDTIRFQADTILGSATNPIVFHAGLNEVQSISLAKGWNWISAHVQPEEATVSELLGKIGTWEAGESIELLNDDDVPYLISYKSVYDMDLRSNVNYWDNGGVVVHYRPERMYRVYAKSAKNIYIEGMDRSFEGIKLHKGWNRIGYLTPMNLPLATALSDYTDDGQDGDIIKSQSEFAVLNVDKNSRTWKGTLKFLRMGEGYMLKRNADTDVSFYYPYYTTGSRYNSNNGKRAKAEVQKAPLYRNTSGASMNVIARIEGIDLQEGDRLVAYGKYGEIRGVAQTDEDELFFLTVGADTSRAEETGSEVSFAIERDGETVATTSLQMPYVADGVKGSIKEPTVISFVPIDGLAGDGWYDLSGRKLQGKPRQKGVYIHNGQRVTIK